MNHPIKFEDVTTLLDRYHEIPLASFASSNETKSLSALLHVDPLLDEPKGRIVYKVKYNGSFQLFHDLIQALYYYNNLE